MDYTRLTSAEKPSSAPEHFTVYEVGTEHFIFCPIRRKSYKVNDKPEEIVRQWWVYRLKELYGYDFGQIEVEVSVKVGSTEAKKKADIVVYGAVSLSGLMFKPFTNTKTCVLFLKKRKEEVLDVSKLTSKRSLVFGVSTKPGKDRSGNLVKNAKGDIISDLPEISSFFSSKIKWSV